MAQVIGGTIAALTLLLVVGALLGRVQAKSCCAVADPRRDLRMRAAYDDDNQGRPQATREP
jgi:hypothetical protein